MEEITDPIDRLIAYLREEVGSISMNFPRGKANLNTYMGIFQCWWGKFKYMYRYFSSEGGANLNTYMGILQS